MNLIIQAPANHSMPRVEALGVQYGYWHEGWRDCIDNVPQGLVNWHVLNSWLQQAPRGAPFLLALEGPWAGGMADNVLCNGMAQMYDDVVNYCRDAQGVQVAIFSLPHAGHDMDACRRATRQCKWIMPELYNFTPAKYAQVGRAEKLCTRKQSRCPIICHRYMGGENAHRACQMMPDDEIVTGVKQMKEMGVEICWLWDSPSHVRHLMPNATVGEVLARYEDDLLAAIELVKGVGN